MMDGRTYHEKLSSFRTEVLFVALCVIFLSFFMLRWINIGWDALTIAFLVFFVIFLFYVLNYKSLKILITPEILQLTFGVFTWKVALSNIESSHIDENSIVRYGGAGIHFMWIKGKYRAFFNFLEYPRVVAVFKKKKGLVREIAFSTKKPEQIIELLQV